MNKLLLDFEQILYRICRRKMAVKAASRAAEWGVAPLAACCLRLQARAPRASRPRPPRSTPPRPRLSLPTQSGETSTRPGIVDDFTVVTVLLIWEFGLLLLYCWLFETEKSFESFYSWWRAFLSPKASQNDKSSGDQAYIQMMHRQNNVNSIIIWSSINFH